MKSFDLINIRLLKKLGTVSLGKPETLNLESYMQRTLFLHTVMKLREFLKKTIHLGGTFPIIKNKKCL